MTEKEIKEKAEQIIEALTAISLGKEPNLLSNEVFKKIADHPNLTKMIAAYISYLQSFNGKVETPTNIKALFDFRMQLVELFETI